MKKLNNAAWVCVIVAVVAVSLSVVAFGGINCCESSGYVDPHSSVIPSVQGVTKSNGYYNISLAFSNVSDPVRLDNILINPHSSGDAPNSTIYVNGTAVNTYPLSSLNSGDSLQVNLTIPTAGYDSRTVYLCIMGDCFGCGRTVALP